MLLRSTLHQTARTALLRTRTRHQTLLARAAIDSSSSASSSTSLFHPSNISLSSSSAAASPAASFATSSSSVSRLTSLRLTADSSPHDAYKQYQLLKEANRVGDYTFVLRRVESGKYATSGSVKFEYEKAKKSIEQQERHEEMRYEQQQQSHQQVHQPYSQYSPSSSYASPSSHHNASFPSTDPHGVGATPTNPVIIREIGSPLNLRESFVSAIPSILVVLGLLGLYAWYTKKNEGNGDAQPSMFNPFGAPKDFLNREMSVVRFSDVKGCDEAKAELEEIVAFLKNPQKFERLGGRMTKGVLLTGPPGTGKTLLAKAVAGEAGVAFFSASGADFDEIFVGVGARRIRDLFAAARKQKKAIIFIDEIDAVGGNRNNIMSSHGRASINALLTEMDGFGENSGIIVIGATNLDESLDPALVRPGRFDRRVAVSLPDTKGRLDILKLYAGKLKVASDIDMELLAKSTIGMSGADLANLLNSAANRASALGKFSIDHDEIEYAHDKIRMGAERNFTMSDEVRANTAYHEAGHTIMLLNTPGAAPLHKVTILPRGRALGVMFSLPTNEHDILTRQELLARIDVAMGGRVAEELLNGKDQITSGASSDLEHASRLARYMVMNAGMGANTGVFTLPDTDGRNVHPAQVVAPETLKQIDEEVAKILKESYERSKQLISQKRVEWERLSQALIEHELLDAKQVLQACRGEEITKKAVNKFTGFVKPPASPPAPPASSSDDSSSSGGIPKQQPAIAKVTP